MCGSSSSGRRTRCGAADVHVDMRRLTPPIERDVCLHYFPPTLSVNSRPQWCFPQSLRDSVAQRKAETDREIRRRERLEREMKDLVSERGLDGRRLSRADG